MIYKTIVIGAGASGLFFASHCQSNDTLVIEKNPYPGKKLNITGKGRCNITNASDSKDFLEHVYRNSSFLYSSLFTLTPENTEKYFNEIGLPTKHERGRRVFPESDTAKDVTNILKKNSKAKFIFNTKVLSVKKENDYFIINTENEDYKSKNLVVATGGLSYPATGSTGDGYNFSKSFGHNLIERSPSLVQLVSNDDYLKELSGLTLKNVNVKILEKDNVLKEEFGELLFTHRGVSGPTILRLSAYYNLDTKNIIIDLKPALTINQLEDRLQREFDEIGKKNIKNILHKLVPKSLIEIILKKSDINPSEMIQTITKEERYRLAFTLKNFKISISGKGGYEEAVITDGGIDVKEINPKTMESKLVDNLYFIGEVLDVSAMTGGYNLQIAFSTAYQAYKAIGEEYESY